MERGTSSEEINRTLDHTINIYAIPLLVLGSFRALKNQYHRAQD
jgi:hypothetical protein